MQTDASLSLVLEALGEGQIVGLPTETVYGLAADATNQDAVARVYETKNRPSLNPLIAHFHSIDAASEHVVFDALSTRLAQAFWPGPLTLVLPVKRDSAVCRLARAGLDTLAIRIPAHPLALNVLQAFRRPLVAPSANISGRLSPTSADHVRRDFGNRFPVLDGGNSAAGIESTIVRVREGRAIRLRAGAITDEQILEVTGQLDEPDIDGPVRAPGTAFRHYAPSVALRLNATDRLQGENHLGFGAETLPCTLNLSPSASLREAAANLFDMLHELEAMGRPVAVSPIPHHALGLALNDRLSRAAASVSGRNA